MNRERVLETVAVVLNWAVLGFAVGAFTAFVLFMFGLAKWGLQ